MDEQDRMGDDGVAGAARASDAREASEGSEAPDDATVVVPSRADDDLTVVRPRTDPDADFRRPHIVDDEATVVRPHPADPDATVVRPRPADPDATVVRPRPADPDVTVVRPRQPAPDAAPDPEATVEWSGSEASSRGAWNPAPPPPDPARARAEASRRGLSGGPSRGGLSRVYGARPVRESAETGPDEVQRRIGAPPGDEPGGAVAPVGERAVLPSLARRSRRERVVTLAAYAGVVAISAAGLVMIARLVFV